MILRGLGLGGVFSVVLVSCGLGGYFCYILDSRFGLVAADGFWGLLSGFEGFILVDFAVLRSDLCG